MVPEGDSRYCALCRFAHQCAFVLHSYAQHLLVVAEEYDQVGEPSANRLWPESGSVPVSKPYHCAQCHRVGALGVYRSLCAYALPGLGGTDVPFAQCRFLVVDARGGYLVVPIGILL